MSFSKLPMKLIPTSGIQEPHGTRSSSGPNQGSIIFDGPGPETGFYEGEGDALC